MAIRVRLNDGVEFIVQSTVEKFREGMKVALENNAVLEVENGSGKKRLVNPVQVVFFEDAEDRQDDWQEVSTAAGR